MRISLYYIYFFVICILEVVYSSEINGTVSVYAGGAGDSINLEGLADFPLKKCFCQANFIYENGECVPKETNVKFLLKYWPQIFQNVKSNVFESVVVQNVKCDSLMSPVELENTAFTKEKSLFHFESGEHFSDNYCIEHVKDKFGHVYMEAHVCLPIFNVPICCDKEFNLNLSSFKCEHDKDYQGNEMNPPVLLGSSLINSSKNIELYLQDFPKCEDDHVNVMTLNNKDVIMKYQQSTIALFVPDPTSEDGMPLVKFPPDYCIGLERKNTSSSYKVLYWNEYMPAHCFESSNSTNNNNEKCDSIMSLALVLLLSVSTIFLLLILVLHAAMADLRKSIGSKITICHVASLFCGFCLLLILHIPYPFNCKIYGPLIQGCFLATFFWLNIMCFDIWWKLWCKSPAGETSQYTKSQFFWYSVYGWGAPLFIVVVTVVMDNVPYFSNTQGIIVPGFGKHHCWFADRTATLVYYFGIVAVLMIFNALFFVWVFGIVLNANCTYNKVLKTNQNSSRRAWIYLKIFGVMGTSWIFEFLSWQEGTCEYWIVTDIINALRGVILFLIFFCSRKSIKKLKQRVTVFRASVSASVNRSVNNLRKMSLKPSSFGETAETALEFRKSSEFGNRQSAQQVSNSESNSGKTRN